MRRKRHRPIFVRKCDYCGTELQLNEPNSDSYVVTMEHKYFCKIHYVGEPPIKDCLEDYIRSKENAKTLRKKEEEQRRLQSNCEKQPEEIKKEKEIRLKNLAKLEAYQKELKLKQWRQRATK